MAGDYYLLAWFYVKFQNYTDADLPAATKSLYILPMIRNINWILSMGKMWKLNKTEMELKFMNHFHEL